MTAQITPAAQRLYEFLNSSNEGYTMTLGEVTFDLSDCQSIVDVVFNLPEGADSTDLLDRVAAALKATLTMMNGNQEQWNKMARQIVVRAGLDEEGKVS